MSIPFPTANTVTVDFTTADGTATAGSDYTATNGTLTFTPGPAPTRTIARLLMQGDTVSETDETFFINLSNAANTADHDSQLGEIRNDADQDDLDRRRIVVEGDSGTVNAVFTVSLFGRNSRVTVQFATVDGSAVAPGDYTAINGTLTLDPGVTTQTVTVAVDSRHNSRGGSDLLRPARRSD